MKLPVYASAILLATIAAPVNVCAQQSSEPAAQPAAAKPAPYVKDPRNWPTPVMDSVAPTLPAMKGRDAILIFSKTNGFRDDPQIRAAAKAIEELGKARDRQVIVTENAAIFNPRQLKFFGTIVFNSTSGNIFTDDQRVAFKGWLEKGGGLVALHGAGGDGRYDWRWWVDTVLGAQFIGHTARPKQFQDATMKIAVPDHPAMAGLPTDWRRNDEWYAFKAAPTGQKTQILATLDEQSYDPPSSQRMGVHPIIWTRCIGRGRVFFSALGHKAETYSEPLHLRLIDNAIGWAGEARRKGC
ncbi:ThuA domain-containing protein [Sphingobium aromaticiconvertens]|uniref:ThuA domain-containing protein n=1 Tax=Sphingobium aromaticiconvertens TaxID=365341 RepID=UPI003018AA66